jgi:hypothetical protein
MVFTDNAAGSPHTVVLTATATAPLSNDNTLASATIKGQSATLGTPSLAPGAATPGTVTISGTQSTSSTASVFTKSDALAEVTRVVKYAFGASTSQFGTDTQYLDSNTISNGDFFVIQVKSESSRYNYYVINVTVALSNDNTLSSATIKGQSATLGTPSIAPGAATPGTVTISTAQSVSTDASIFTKSDALATVTRVVKYASGASTSQFGTDTQYLDSSSIANGDFFVIQVKSESSRYNYYVINVTVASAGPGFSASTPTIPNTYVGSNSPTQTVTITNTGTANLVYGRRAVVLNGTNSSDFAIVADNCSGRSIAATRTCTVSFRFSPTSTGSRTANLVFTDNATGSPHTVVLTGTGIAAPLTISRLSEKESGVRGGGRLTITGTGFANSATVTIGDVAAVVLERSGTTKITVRIPAHARGLVSVVVTNPDLTSASIGGFRYR